MTMLFQHTNYAALLHFPFFTEATSCSLTLLRPSPMRTAVFETYKESQESASRFPRLLRPSPMRTAVFRHTKYAALLHFPFFTEATSRLEPGVKKGQRRTARLFQINISHFPYRLPFSLRI